MDKLILRNTTYRFLQSDRWRNFPRIYRDAWRRRSFQFHTHCFRYLLRQCTPFSPAQEGKTFCLLSAYTHFWVYSRVAPDSRWRKLNRSGWSCSRNSYALRVFPFTLAQLHTETTTLSLTVLPLPHYCWVGKGICVWSSGSIPSWLFHQFRLSIEIQKAMAECGCE